jgi:hypothetical protein
MGYEIWTSVWLIGFPALYFFAMPVLMRSSEAIQDYFGESFAVWDTEKTTEDFKIVDRHKILRLIKYQSYAMVQIMNYRTHSKKTLIADTNAWNTGGDHVTLTKDSFHFASKVPYIVFPKNYLLHGYNTIN